MSRNSFLVCSACDEIGSEYAQHAIKSLTRDRQTARADRVTLKFISIIPSCYPLLPSAGVPNSCHLQLSPQLSSSFDAYTTVVIYSYGLQLSSADVAYSCHLQLSSAAKIAYSCHLQPIAYRCHLQLSPTIHYSCDLSLTVVIRICLHNL
jgi:hypothetical protein